MASPVATRRIEVLEAARADPEGFLRFAPEALRFSLGTSLGDLAIPIEVDPEARGIVRGAALEVALLLTCHHRSFVPAEVIDRLLLREDSAALPPVPARLGPGKGGGPDLRAAAQLGPGVHPALTGGLVTAWMGRGGRGRSLVALFIELLRRAFEERAETRGREPTPVIVALALAAECDQAARGLDAALPGPPLDRYLRTAARGALWLAARTGLARAWREGGRPADDPLLARLEACLGPAALLDGRSGALGGRATVYGCELGPVPHADDLLARLAEGEALEAIRGELEAALAADRDLSLRAELAVGVARFREVLASALGAAEADGRDGGLAPLRDLLCGPGTLAATLGEPGARKELARRCIAAAPGPEAGALLERAARLAGAWHRKEPGVAVGLSREAARAEYALAATAFLCDLALDRLAGGARRALSFRTGQEAEGGAEAEWEAGRLYLLSAGPGPIRKEPADRPVGHLFADVKDFTRRTAAIGPAAMAEFLRREFYLPIVAAAKAHYSGMSHLADRGGVSLNNLLGDAVSFTGRIDAMVALARAIRAQFAAYAARLAAQGATEGARRQLDQLTDLHDLAVGEARTALHEAEAALEGAAPGTAGHAAATARVVRARTEEAHAVEERTRALARARGEGLEAGTFISFGPAPLLVVIEDEAFGRNRLAIADKINESARGTARAPQARAHADAALARARVRAGNPALAHAWSVFIGQPLTIHVPPDVEADAVRRWRAGDVHGAMRALAVPCWDGLEAAAREEGERPGDIYNGGTALSHEALEAYLAEVGQERTVRRVTVDPETLPAALTARWFYGEEPLDLIACLEGTRVAELFRRVGRAAFKGLGGVVVWELGAEDGGPGALADALGARWREAAEGR